MPSNRHEVGRYGKPAFFDLISAFMSKVLMMYSLDVGKLRGRAAYREIH